MITIKLRFSPNDAFGFDRWVPYLQDSIGTDVAKGLIYCNENLSSISPEFSIDLILKHSTYMPTKLWDEGFELHIEGSTSLTEIQRLSLIPIINCFGDISQRLFLKKLSFIGLSPQNLFVAKNGNDQQWHALTGLLELREVEAIEYGRPSDFDATAFLALCDIVKKNKQLDRQRMMRIELINFIESLRVAPPEPTSRRWFNSGANKSAPQFDIFQDWVKHGQVWLSALEQRDEAGNYINSFDKAIQKIIDDLTNYPRSWMFGRIQEDPTLNIAGCKAKLLNKMASVSLAHLESTYPNVELKQPESNNSDLDTDAGADAKPCLITTQSCTAVVKQFVSVVCNSQFCGMRLAVSGVAVDGVEKLYNLATPLDNVPTTQQKNH